MDFKEKVRTFIANNLVVLEEIPELKDTDNIFELGFVNSLFAMKLLSYVESEFGIRVNNEEMDIKNFSSVEAISQLIAKKSNN
jgi:methoxymalonate biosynthesis acyl carrier protein